MDFSQLAEELRLDLWVCEHYKVLPTDERFLKLSGEQKYLLLVSFLEQPTAEQMKQYYYQQMSGPRFTDSDKKSLQKRGYSAKAVERIEDQLRVAGLIR